MFLRNDYKQISIYESGHEMPIHPVTAHIKPKSTNSSPSKKKKIIQRQK